MADATAGGVSMQHGRADRLTADQLESVAAGHCNTADLPAGYSINDLRAKTGHVFLSTPDDQFLQFDTCEAALEWAIRDAYAAQFSRI